MSRTSPPVDPRDDDLSREERIDALIDGVEIVRSRVARLDNNLTEIEKAREIAAEREEAREGRLDEVESALDRLEGRESDADAIDDRLDRIEDQLGLTIRGSEEEVVAASDPDRERGENE